MITTRRYFGRTAALTVTPKRWTNTPKPDTSTPVAPLIQAPARRAPPDWWEVVPPDHFTEFCASQVLRMSFSPQAVHVIGMTIAGSSLKPRAREVPAADWYSAS